MKKQNSVIGKTRLNTATFHNVSFSPSWVNFFFGDNGTGKSTLSGELAKKILRPDPDDPDAPVPEILCFGKRYIEDLLREPGNLKGVLSLNTKEEQARDKQRREVQAEYDATAEKLRQAQSEYDQLNNAVQAQIGAYKELFWDFSEAVRREHPKIFREYGEDAAGQERLWDLLLSGNYQKENSFYKNSSAWMFLYESVKNILQRYTEKTRALTEQMQPLLHTVAEAKALLAEYRTRIKALEGALPGTLRAMNRINDMLERNGFTGFRLAESGDHPGRYVLIRPGQEENTPAENLSEGERNFIAFLYFYHEVMAPDPDSGALRPKVVIIDDPVSSMDSHVMLVVSGIIREMLAICLNNARAETPASKEHYIRQMFILSHNSHFFWAVSGDYVQDYEHVNYYLLQKTGNDSSLTLCTQRSPSAPMLTVNYIPTMDDYVKTWIAYRQETDPQKLLTTIRKILNRCFLQDGEYSQESLNYTLRVEKKDCFVTPDGDFDSDGYRRMDILMTYITQMDLPVPSLQYTRLDPDADTLRETVKTIFTRLNQDQHYDAMMKKAAKFL